MLQADKMMLQTSVCNSSETLKTVTGYICNKQCNVPVLPCSTLCLLITLPATEQCVLTVLNVKNVLAE